MDLRTVLQGCTRMQNSPSGNPRWKLHTSHGVYVTAMDSDVNYGLQNLPWFNDEKPVPVTLELNSMAQVVKASDETNCGSSRSTSTRRTTIS